MPSVTASSAAEGGPAPGRALWAGLLVFPLALRTTLEVFLQPERSYDEVVADQLARDPTFLSIAVFGLVVAAVLIRRNRSLVQLGKPPFVFFVLYALMLGFFGMISGPPALALFLATEFLLYYVAAAICVRVVRQRGLAALLSLEGVLLAFTGLLVAIACIDLVLPWTQPFDTNPTPNLSGRPRFDGAIVPLISVQWSTMAALTLMLSLGRLLRRDRTWHMVALVAASASLLFLTGTRGAMGGAAAGLLVMALRLRRRVPPVAWSSLLLIGVIGLGTLPFLPFADQTVRTVEVALRLEDTGNVSSFNGRLAFWRSAGAILAERPLAGYGAEWRARPPGLDGGLHNMSLESWAGAGIAGAFFFLAGVLWIGWRLRRNPPRAGPMARTADIHGVVSVAFAIWTYEVIHGLVEGGAAGVNNFFFVALLYCLIVAQSLGPRRRWAARDVPERPDRAPGGARRLATAHVAR